MGKLTFTTKIGIIFSFILVMVWFTYIYNNPYILFPQKFNYVSNSTYYDIQYFTYTNGAQTMIQNEYTLSTQNLSTAYLIDALTPSHYWFQLGVSYYWDPECPGFAITYEIWNGTQSLTKPCLPNKLTLNTGNKIMEKIWIYKNGTVNMEIINLNTSKNFSVTYNNVNASFFIPIGNVGIDKQGNTGTLIEQISNNYINFSIRFQVGNYSEELKCIDRNCNPT